MFARTDCNGLAYYNYGYFADNPDKSSVLPIMADEQPDLDTFHGNDICDVLRFNIHLLQALYIAVACTLYRITRQLGSSMKMQKYIPGARELPSMVALMIVVPIVSGVLDVVSQQPREWYAKGNGRQVVVV